MRWWALGSALFLFVACGSKGGDDPAPAAGDPPPATSGGPTAPPGIPAAPPTPAKPSDGCAGLQPTSGDVDWTLSSGGKDRTVHVHVPSSYAPNKPIPVVLDFHGFTSNAQEQELLTGMKEKGDTAGFVAVHPEGLGTSQSWNAGACCGDAADQKIDDIKFVSDIIDALEARLCVDTRRIFATGMSNGGFLSHRIACELSARVAAVAPVAGVLGVPTCTPTRPMSLMQFHGTLDPLVPYDGSTTLGFPPVEKTIADWATRSGCNGTTRDSFDHGDVKCVTYDGCAQNAEVVRCTVTGGGHTWPGGLPVPSLGYTTNDIHATDAMWDFFVRHPLP
jgi:polyhydroxybutyrate depolymerase